MVARRRAMGLPSHTSLTFLPLVQRIAALWTTTRLCLETTFMSPTPVSASLSYCQCYKLISSVCDPFVCETFGTWLL